MGLVALLARLVQRLLVRWVRMVEAVLTPRHRLGRPLRNRVGTPLPVVLVPGFANTRQSLREWQDALEADGFSVFAYDDPWQGLGDIPASARHLDAYVDEVLAESGQSEVMVVGYSLGGVIARWWALLSGGAGRCRLIVTVASPHLGTVGATVHGMLRRSRGMGPVLYDVLPEARRQLVAGSDVMRRLGSAPQPDSLRIVSIYNPHGDGVIWPPRSPELPGAELVPVAHRGGRLRRRLLGNHYALAHWNAEVYERIRGALLGL